MLQTATPLALGNLLFHATQQFDGRDELIRKLTDFQTQLASASGANLVSVVIFGGLARGRYRPGRSDVNVLIVLERDTAADLAAIAPPLRSAWRAARVEPMILTNAELAPSARAFPTKFLDIKEHHIRIAGIDVLAQLEIPKDRILWRIEQELRNIAIRLRRRITSVIDEPKHLVGELTDIARPVAIEFYYLLRTRGHQPPEEDRTAAIFAAAASAFALDGPALAELAALRQDPKARPGNELELLGERVIRSLLTAADAAASHVSPKP